MKTACELRDFGSACKGVAINCTGLGLDREQASICALASTCQPAAAPPLHIFYLLGFHVFVDPCSEIKIFFHGKLSIYIMFCHCDVLVGNKSR